MEGLLLLSAILPHLINKPASQPTYLCFRTILVLLSLPLLSFSLTLLPTLLAYPSCNSVQE